MESEEDVDSNIRKQFDSRKKRKKKVDSGSDNSQTVRDSGVFVVGMVAVTKTDGLFNDPHKVGRFIGERLGAVNSVKVTRSGMVVIDCLNELQMAKALKIKVYGLSDCVRCFVLGGGLRTKGVISGVPVDFDEEEFLEVEGVTAVRRLSRYSNGVRVESTMVCLDFQGALPEKVTLDYVSYRVRVYERAPLRCFCCLAYGHVAAVCRGRKRCGKCGKYECNGRECVVDQVKCVHCGGGHYTGARACPVRMREVEIGKAREGNNLTYAEALKKVEGEGQPVGEKKDRDSSVREEHGFVGVDKTRFLAFISMVVNCAVEISSKSERIKMILDAAGRFLGVLDVSGEEINRVLRGGFTSTQAVMSE